MQISLKNNKHKISIFTYDVLSISNKITEKMFFCIFSLKIMHLIYEFIGHLIIITSNSIIKASILMGNVDSSN